MKSQSLILLCVKWLQVYRYLLGINILNDLGERAVGCFDNQLLRPH